MRTIQAAAATAMLLLAACGGGAGQPAAEPSTAGPVISTADSTATTPAVETTTTEGAVALVQIGQTGFTQFEQYGRADVVAAAEVVNASTAYVTTAGYVATLLDAQGGVLDETNGWLGFTLAPGDTTWLLPNFQLEEGAAAPASMTVVLDEATVADELIVATGPMPVDAAIEPVSGVLYNDINSVTHLEAVFHNVTDARLTTVAGVCGIYVDGALVGGASGYVNEMLPGADAGMDASIGMMSSAPFPDDVRCWAGPVNISTYEPGVSSSGLEVQAGLTFNPAGGDGTYYDTMVGVTVHNPTSQAALGVHVEVDVLDADGRIVHVAVPSDTYVLPGETVYTGIAPVMSTDSTPPAGAVARTRVEAWGDPTNASLGSTEGLDLTAHPYEVSGTSAYVSVGLLMFGGTLVTTGGLDLDAPVISCAALTGGAPVAGSSWTLGEVPEGVPTTFEIITSFGMVPAYDEVRCTLHLTSITEIG